MPRLTAHQIEELTKAHPNWKLEDGKIVRDWQFKDFFEAMTFVNTVADLAEEVGHHPDIAISYTRVRLSLVSHDSGGITDRDARMVIQIEGKVP
jgi:4a-hydroxytetrahydrobiopterin dehydratase